MTAFTWDYRKSLENRLTIYRPENHDDAENYNFDHPEALDFDLAYEKIQELVAGKDCEIPTYDFALHLRTKIKQKVKTAPIVIFEGIHSIYEERFRKLMDLKIFVLTPDDIRLARRSKSKFNLNCPNSFARYR